MIIKIIVRTKTKEINKEFELGPDGKWISTETEPNITIEIIEE